MGAKEFPQQCNFPTSKFQSHAHHLLNVIGAITRPEFGSSPQDVAQATDPLLAPGLFGSAQSIEHYARHLIRHESAVLLACRYELPNSRLTVFHFLCDSIYEELPIFLFAPAEPLHGGVYASQCHSDTRGREQPGDCEEWFCEAQRWRAMPVIVRVRCLQCRYGVIDRHRG